MNPSASLILLILSSMIYLVPAAIESTCKNPGDVTLTFDYGPGPLTAKLLDSLKEHQIPAAFHVTVDSFRNQDMTDVVLRAFEEGHTIGIFIPETAEQAAMESFPEDDPVFIASTIQQISIASNWITSVIGTQPKYIRFASKKQLPVELRRIIETKLGFTITKAKTEIRDETNKMDSIWNSLAKGLANASPQNNSFIFRQRDNMSSSVASIVKIVEMLSEKGYRIVPLTMCVRPRPALFVDSFLSSITGESRMLIKFEQKCNRVKGLAFHPKRPWVLASLHNGSVQLWDYRMGILVDKFDEHEGPVRGCDFHPSQPLFVTGGDDGKIRVFNYQQRRLLFTLNGHMDYVRTAFFHHEAPWIVSASDDQTVRVWNWQSRSCLAVLTGHSHYVMCAQFHPSEDLIVSASLDQTIRVWNVSSLRRKHSSPASTPYGESTSPRPTQIDLFGAPDGQVKFVLEGHDRGVNWVQFHPSKPFIVSASDDRSVKLWRYNDSRAWETDSFRGHFNNISCVMFHPHTDLIISNSEDKTLRIWDYTKRGAQPTIFKKDTDRFWILASHPTLNLIAAGHDNGFMIFKLEHERPVYSVFEDKLFHLKGRSIVSVDLNEVDNKKACTETSILSLEIPVTLPSTLSYSAADNALLLSMIADGGSYKLVNIRSGSGDFAKDGNGIFGVFVARNRFAVLDESAKQIHIKSLDNTIFRTVAIPEGVTRILQASLGSFFMVSKDTVFLYDLLQDGIIGEVSISDAKYAISSSDSSKIAFMARQNIFVVDRKSMSIISTIRESVNIKSAIWDSRGILFFTNPHHLKYVLPNGDVGVICTLQVPMYLIRVKGDIVTALDRNENLNHLPIDSTEVLFKLALVQGDHTKVLEMIENSNLIGQSIISYLRNNGFAEIALGFVTDPATRFELGVECCDLDTAFEAATSINSNEVWNRLADESLMLGNFRLAEKCLQKAGNLNRLSFLHLVTSNSNGLQDVCEEARVTNNRDVLIQNSLLLGDNIQFATSMLDSNLPALAFMACKSAGMDGEADGILRRNSIDKALFSALQIGNLSRIQPLDVSDDSWPLTDDPLKTKVQLVKKKISFNTQEPLSQSMYHSDYHPDETSFNSVVPPFEMEEGGWDVDDSTLKLDDLDLDDYDETSGFLDVEDGRIPPNGPSDPIPLVSQIPFYHFAAGDIQTGIDLLKMQSGIGSISHLEPLIMRCLEGTSVPFMSFDQSLGFFTRQNQKDGHKHILATPIFTMKMIQEELDEAFNLTTGGKFSEASKLFENLLHVSLFTVASDEDENVYLNNIIVTCREYLTGLRWETQRKEFLSSDEARSLKLVCYFTTRSLRNDHLILSLRAAMVQAYKLQCIKLAGKLARRLLQCEPNETIAVQARKVASLADKLPLNHTDPVGVELQDLQNNIVIDCRDAEPILTVHSIGECPHCGAVYKAEYNGSICVICNLGCIGAETTGRISYEGSFN